MSEKMLYYTMFESLITGTHGMSAKSCREKGASASNDILLYNIKKFRKKTKNPTLFCAGFNAFLALL